MSYRPGIIKSAGLTNVVPLAGVEPAIPQGAYKSRAFAGQTLKALQYIIFCFLTAFVQRR